MYQYKVRVRLPNTSGQDVVVRADSSSNARAMVEAQYGKGSIVAGPTRI